MDHPECAARLHALRVAGVPHGGVICVKNRPDWRKEDWVTAEDAQAREDAMKFLDGAVPMALEKPEPEFPRRPENPQPQAEDPKPKRRRLTPAEREERDRLKAEDRERRAAERKEATEARRAERKEQRDREKAEAKAAALAEKISLAEGGTVALPAVVLRDGTVRHVSDSDAWAVIEMYLDDLKLDCETSGYPLGHDLYELRTVQLGGEHAAIVFDALDPAQLQIVALALTLAGKLRAHSATADVIPVVEAGLIAWDDIWAKMQDSVLDAKLTDPKMSGSDADALKELSAQLLQEYAVSPQAEKAKNELFAAMGCLVKTDLLTPPAKNGWYRVNRFSVVMTRYAGSDVLDLAAVLRVLPPLPVDQSVMEREREFQAACAPVTWVGFKLDHEHILKQIGEAEEARAEAQQNVLILSDGKITNPKSKDVITLLPEIIPGLVLGINRKTKRPSAARDSLEKLALDYLDRPLEFHLLKQILAYRQQDTKLGLLLRPLEALCSCGDGRMRPTVYTIEAVTGRCSCRRPNGQQFSRQGGVRACVHADPGFLGISADFEGCEIRVGAGLSGDQALYEAEVSPFCWKCERVTVTGDECSCGYKDDGKLAGHTGLHWRTAHSAHGKDATYEHRYQAKRGTFTKLFGGGPETAAAQVYCQVADMQKLFRAFEADSPVFTTWDKQMRAAFKEGSLAWRDYATGENHFTPIEGRNRMVYRAYSGRNIYISTGEHAAGNGAIQGTAREVLVDGTLNWKRTPWGRYPLLPVHDQILAYVPAPAAREATAELARCMETTVLSSPGFEVRIGADVDEPFDHWPDSS